MSKTYYNIYKDSSGNVGIGTTTPGSTLEIARGSGTSTAKLNGTTYSSHFNYATDEHTYIRGGKATSKVYLNDSHSADVLIASGGGSVGIGITNPSYPLDLGTGGSGNSIRARRIWASGTGIDSGFTLDNTLIYQDSGNKFNITIPGSYPNIAFTIDTAGKAGIGTTSPGALLEVAGAIRSSTVNSSQLGEIQFNGTAYIIKGGPYTGDIRQVAPRHRFYHETESTILAQFDSGTSYITNSNVGIGTTSPNQLLEVSNSSTTVGPVIRLSNLNNAIDAGGTHGAIEFFSGDNSNPADQLVTSIKSIHVSTSPNYGELAFHTGSNVEQVRIDKNGNLGINTTTPSQKLHVVDNSLFEGNVYNSGFLKSYGAITINANESGVFLGSYTGGTSIACGDIALSTNGKTGWEPGDELGRIRFFLGDASGVGIRDVAKIIGVNEDGDGSTTTTGSGALAFHTSPYNSASLPERMRIASDGNVGIGTTSPKAPLHVGTGTAGNYFGGKTFSLSNTFADALSIELPNHAGCYVKVFVTGNWSLHSAIAYVGEFFIQNGDNGYSQPGLIISETDNTYNGSVSAQIVDSTTDTFVIQLKLSDTGSLTAQLSYQIMGTITTIS